MYVKYKLLMYELNTNDNLQIIDLFKSIQIDFSFAIIWGVLLNVVEMCCN